MSTLTLYFHIIGALLLVGGMLFFTFVAAPYFRSLEDERETAKHFKGMGRRFKTLGFLAWTILLVTGFLNNFKLGVEFDAELLDSTYGQILVTKLTLIAILITSSAVHDFYIGPKARNDHQLAYTQRIVGRINLVLALVVVYFAVQLRLAMMGS